jgi:hypothetical protein
LLFGTFSSAEVTELDYTATFGIFGKVGTIKNRLTQDSKTYKIETTVLVEGLAKVLMRNPTEHYTSKGRMENGLMIADSYTMVSTKQDKKVSKEYTIDHKNKYVTKRYRKWRSGKLIADKTEKLDFYATDDLLTLYFNLGTAVKQKGKIYMFHAVGLEKQDGKVQITAPSDAQTAPYIKDLGLGAKLYVKALIHQKNFRKKKGDILLSVAEDGFIYNAVIKDILFYGDAHLKRVK